MNYMTKIKYGEPFLCHSCSSEAMFMDKDKKWWCFFNWKDSKEHYGICKANNNNT